MADLPWVPTTKHVAAYIPTRTRDQTDPGSDLLLGDFNSTTTPTKTTVEETFIPGAVAVVTAACGTVPDTLTELAQQAAALRAAADIELTYPERDADVEVYRDLNTRAKDALTRLVDAVGDAGGGPEALLPVWQAPDPASWGDTNL